MKTLLMIAMITGLTACAPIRGNNGPSVEHGLSTAGSGLGHLLLSPFQIATGLLEGVASLSYYLTGGLHDINKGMEQAQANITLGDTYQAAYGKSLNEVSDNGNTGMVFSKMSQATNYFQKVLQRNKVANSQRYILTSLDSRGGEHILLAVVYRPYQPITVFDKYSNKNMRQLTVQERPFYEPFQFDSSGKPLDNIIDWAALPKDQIETQKAQAVLLTLAANSVTSDKRSPEYWQNEKRWLAGQEADIVRERESYVKSRMGM